MKDPIKVLVFTIWYPDHEMPHIGVFVEEQARALRDHCLVKVIHINTLPLGGIKIELKKETRHGLVVYRANHGKVRIPMCSFILFMAAAIRAFLKVINSGFRPDIIHAHVFNSGVPAVFIGKIFRIPVIITEHFTYIVEQKIRGRSMLRAKFAFNGAQAVIAVSRYLKEHILKLGIRKRIVVIPNIVNLRKLNQNLSSSDNALISVGHYIQRKGFDILLRALSLIKKKEVRFHLDLIGSGDPSAHMRLAEELNIFDNVTFHGSLTHEEVIHRMASSTLFVLPTRLETFGVVFIEAMACGLPVVAPDIRPVNEIVPDFAGKLVKIQDERALADAVMEILGNPGSYQPERISQYALKYFGEDAVCWKILEVYRDTLGVYPHPGVRHV